MRTADLRGMAERALRAAGVTDLTGNWSLGGGFRPRPGGSAPIRIRLDEGWVGLEAPVSVDAAECTGWGLLERNGGLPEASRIVRTGGPGSAAVLRVDLPVLGDPGEAQRWRRAAAGLLAAWTSCAGEPWAPAPDRDAREEEDGEDREENENEAGGSGSPVAERPDAKTLATWIRDAGWPCRAREDGRVTAELGGRGHNRQVSVEIPETGPVSLRMRLAARSEAEEDSPALACFLLRLSALRRMVRAAADARDAPGAGIRLEVPLVEPLGPAIVAPGMAALAVAVRHGWREARALAESKLGSQFAGLWCPE